jgi:MFS transporter, FLVCR family, feline leukemia virus subgroup C receptor-related protein
MGTLKGKNEPNQNGDKETTFSDSSSNVSDVDRAYKLYPQRWLVLASFSLLSTDSAWVWITFSPMATSMADFWNVSIEHVDALAAIYLYIYVPFSFVSLYLVVNHLGLARGLLLGGLFNVTGAAMRWYFLESYNAVYFGTLLAAYAQTYTLSTPPLIANRWFGSHERATATALGVLANQMGTAVGLGITAVVDMEMQAVDNVTLATSSALINERRLKHYLFLQTIVAFVALLLVGIFVRDRPPTPPSKAAAGALGTEEQHHRERFLLSESATLVPHTPGDGPLLQSKSVSYGDSIRRVVGSSTNVSFVLTFGMTVGVFYTIPAFLSQLLPFTNNLFSSVTAVSGWLGILYEAGGTMGSLGAGRLVDVTQHHRPVYTSLLLLAAISLGFFSIAVSVGDPWTRNITIAISVVLSGFGLAASNTIGLDYGTAVMYPADEAAVAGVMECAAELFGFVWVTMGGSILTQHAIYGRSTLLGILAGTVFCSFLISRMHHYNVKRPS